MPTPPKPVFMLEIENRSHRTKAEKEQRAAAERELLTGVHMAEWPSVRRHPEAHREYMRIRRLLKTIEKDDGLYQGVINRYCILKAECTEMEEKREEFSEAVKRLESRFYGSKDNGGLDSVEFYKLLGTMMNSVVGCDKQVQAKRRMLLDIEKENIMTVASALRSVPKRVDANDEDDELMQMMREQAERRRRFAENSG